MKTLFTCPAVIWLLFCAITYAFPVTPVLIRAVFYYDSNLDGRRGPGEPLLKNLVFENADKADPGPDGALLLPAGQDKVITVSGISPAGKQLKICTLGEPFEVRMLPRLTIQGAYTGLEIGLADGFLTSPLNPVTLNWTDYSNALRTPAAWLNNALKYFPAGWDYEPNYYYYGYRIPEGGLAGTPHLAFDIWAVPGTPVLAAAPGTIVKPLYDWKFGISGPYGTVYYNHIVPTVKIGEQVRRYQVVGTIAENQGNHLHFEMRPEPAHLLSAFPGVDRDFLIKSPVKGEELPVMPFFAE